MWWGNHWMWGGFLWFFLWIFVIIGLIFLVKWIVQQNKPKETKHEDSALEILNKRYVKGEINKEEFEEKKRALLS